MTDDLVHKALQGAKYPIAQLISLFEDSRAQTAPRRQAVMQAILKIKASQSETISDTAFIVGITGSPGAGKSSLTGILAQRLIAEQPGLRVAVLAIDPSSHISGGSLLGDRTRVHFPLDEKRLFFRSQAADQELGGISRNTFQVCRLLEHFFDIIFIETVGIGQNEIEIHRLVDLTALVMQPMAGDQIQFMKAGIMEIPDFFIINKSDAKRAAMRSYHNLKASLNFARPSDDSEIPILLTSATQMSGIDELARLLLKYSRKRSHTAEQKKIQYHFHKWVQIEYGRHGLKHLQQNQDRFQLSPTEFEASQFSFSQSIEKNLNSR